MYANTPSTFRCGVFLYILIALQGAAIDSLLNTERGNHSPYLHKPDSGQSNASASLSSEEGVEGQLAKIVSTILVNANF